MRVEDGRESECRPVMGRIGVEQRRHYPAGNGAQFCRVRIHEKAKCSLT